jgi:hypothetical protein
MATQEELDKILELLNEQETLPLAVQMMHGECTNIEIMKLLETSKIDGATCVAIADYIFEDTIKDYFLIRGLRIGCPKRDLKKPKSFMFPHILISANIIQP